MANILNAISIGHIAKNITKLQNATNFGAPGSLNAYFSELAVLGVTLFDFADDMAAVTRDGGNANTAIGAFPPDGTGAFIKFENRSDLYNVYDAGNFMTGKAYSLLNVPLNFVSVGAHANNLLLGRNRTKGLLDSNTDQQALRNGYNFGGVGWKK